MHRYIVTTLIVSLIAVLGLTAMAQQPSIVMDLKSASQLAIRTSSQIGSAEASADMSKAEIGKVKSALYPSVGAESGYSYLTKPTFFSGTPVLKTNTVINRLGIQQTVYSGGAVQANLNRAQHGYLAASQGARAAQADVLTNVGTSYFRARQARETIDVANASVKSLEASYDVANKLRDSGVVTNSDVLRAQVALTSAKSDSIMAVNNYDIALATLRTAIGLPQDARIDLASDATDTALDIGSSAAPVERPEIAAGSATILAAEADKKAARAGKLPVVALSADYLNEPEGAQFPRLTNTVMAGVLLKFNVFDGGLTRASINEADAASRKAQMDLESEKRRVELEQQTAKLDLDSARARVETTATQVQSAEESLRALQAGYKEGMTPLTDILSAQTALTAAKVSRLTALYDVKIAQVNLLRAYGQTDMLVR